MKNQRTTRPIWRQWSSLILLQGCIGLAAAQVAETGASALSGSVSERDFLADMPIVLSVSRLPQRLDETPGAVTIIDRDMIRLSGARDVADLLRLVPGFQTSTSFETVAPLASYHGGFDSYSNRIQVLVDGRSVYSPYFIGSVGPGLQTVALADIERIEVLRGSNSAAYGARALLGVINIVTRSTLDTRGAQVALATGQNGVGDAQANIGWGDAGASFRLGLDRRADAGLAGSNGGNQVRRVNLSADLHPTLSDEVQLRAGHLAIDTGKGFANKADDFLRDTGFASSFVQLDWRRSLADEEDLALSLSHSQESYEDSFPYSLVPLGINDSINLSGSGKAANDTLSLQHTFRHGDFLRVIWGGELRREKVTSNALYNTDAALVSDFTRLFGNAEWRLGKTLLLNLGAMAEHSSVNGDNLAPRLMLNWHLTPEQTLRAGISKAFRPPSTFEKFANMRYFWNGTLLAVTTLASGNVVPEQLLVRELGYLGTFPRFGIDLDVRLFHEQFTDFLRQSNKLSPKDYVNDENFPIRGVEYQFKWRPWRGAQWIFNQAYVDIFSPNLDATVLRDSTPTALAAPKLATTLTFFQKLASGLDLSLMHQDSGTVTLQAGGRDQQVAFTRTDLRLAWPLRFGARHGELALVVQNLGSPYPDLQPEFQFQRRAFITLVVEN
jgi:iron complex outermembrane receptor protein